MGADAEAGWRAATNEEADEEEGSEYMNERSDAGPSGPAERDTWGPSGPANGQERGR